MSKYIAYLAAILLIAAASTGVVLAKQYQFTNQLQPANQSANMGSPSTCPCQQAGLDCHCADNGQTCNCANQCNCQSNCHKTQGQSPTAE